MKSPTTPDSLHNIRGLYWFIYSSTLKLTPFRGCVVCRRERWATRRETWHLAALQLTRVQLYHCDSLSHQTPRRVTVSFSRDPVFCHSSLDGRQAHNSPLNFDSHERPALNSIADGSEHGLCICTSFFIRSNWQHF